MSCFNKICHCVKNCNCKNSTYVIKGERGATGPAGPVGSGLQVQGTLPSADLLPLSPPSGTSFFVGENGNTSLYVYDDKTKSWQNEGSIKGEKGEKGEKGDSGINITNATYLVTLRDPSFVIPDEGLEIRSGERLPIKNIHDRSTTQGVVTLDAQNNTLSFLEGGAYEITATFNGFVKFPEGDFQPDRDFLCVGFREVNSDNVYIGVNDYNAQQTPHNITMQGILQIPNPTKPYEIVNLQKKSLFLLGGKKSQTLTNSYFTTPILTLIIKKLS